MLHLSQQKEYNSLNFCFPMFAYILSYLIGEVDTLLANDTATIEEIMTTMSVEKNEKT